MSLEINGSLSTAGDCAFAVLSPANRPPQNKRPMLPLLYIPGNIHELSRNDPPSPPANPPPSPRRRLSTECSLSHTPFNDGEFSQEMWEDKYEPNGRPVCTVIGYKAEDYTE
ncbi:MAG: hypothetical protein M1813_003669 [Trichoglossum hirsutum]|nr:MAG: hypothetical protein M1813_003669 [Trichoglossum hirsutum]